MNSTNSCFCSALFTFHLQTEQIFEQIHEELPETADDTKEAQLAIQEGIHKAEKER